MYVIVLICQTYISKLLTYTSYLIIYIYQLYIYLLLYIQGVQTNVFRVQDHHETIPELTTCILDILCKFQSSTITENGTLRCISDNILVKLKAFLRAFA